MPEENDAPETVEPNVTIDAIVDALFSKFQLAEMYGQVLASMIMLSELLPALVQAGILNKPQVDDMLTRASTTLDLALADQLSRQPRAGDRLARVKDRTESAFAGFRQRVIAVSVDQ